MNQQIVLNGQSFEVVDGCIHVDYKRLITKRLEEIPTGVTVLYENEGRVDLGYVVGLRNIGEGKIQALANLPIAARCPTQLSPLCDDAYDEAIQTLVCTREDEIGDVCFIDEEDVPDEDCVWIGITVQADSIEDLFAKAKGIADEIEAPLDSLLGEIETRLDSFGKRSR